jgi:hypothetical protein
VGIKATVTDPSANNLLRKLGIIKAKVNESAKIPVPIKAALVISRMRPRILEIMVNRDNRPPSRTSVD